MITYERRNWNAKEAKMNCVTETPDGELVGLSRFLERGEDMFG